MTEQEQKQKNLEKNLVIMANMLNELARMYREGVEPEQAWMETHKIDSFLADSLAQGIMLLYGEEYVRRRYEKHKDEIERLTQRMKYLYQEGFSPEAAWEEIDSMNHDAAETFAMMIDYGMGGVKH